MKECMGDGWWEWWVDRTDGEVPLKELCESGLERLELGWWREAGSWFQRRGEINSFPIFITVQVFTTPFRHVCYLCSFSQIFTIHWLDTLQTWLELWSQWFDYLEELLGLSFWVRCFQVHAHAVQLLFIQSELSLYLQFLISFLIFAFCFSLFPGCFDVSGCYFLW